MVTQPDSNEPTGLRSTTKDLEHGWSVASGRLRHRRRRKAKSLESLDRPGRAQPSDRGEPARSEGDYSRTIQYRETHRNHVAHVVLADSAVLERQRDADCREDRGQGDPIAVASEKAPQPDHRLAESRGSRLGPGSRSKQGARLRSKPLVGNAAIALVSLAIDHRLASRRHRSARATRSSCRPAREERRGRRVPQRCEGRGSQPALDRPPWP